MASSKHGTQTNRDGLVRVDLRCQSSSVEHHLVEQEAAHVALIDGEDIAGAHEGRGMCHCRLMRISSGQAHLSIHGLHEVLRSICGRQRRGL